jgi:hypothetical protein
MDKILRVSVMTNYNQSDPEIRALDKYEAKGWKCFVNSNSFTKIRDKRPAIVTLNAYLDKFVIPKGRLKAIRAARIKFVHGGKLKVLVAQQKAKNWAIRHNIPVLYTFMRFRKKDTLNAYTDRPGDYIFEKGYFRLKENIRLTYVSNMIKANYKVCDPFTTGCAGCNTCQKLTYPNTNTENYKLAALDLRESGTCKYRCPNCFAKVCLQRTGGKPAFDKIKVNKKMKSKS